ncbi:hypothetical protein PSMK_28370 [Phycisphaera mikurensis NBRC 102666]|uniref:DUF937 domain-containing protein n=2 Tax=Phycisphaera TaxID=666508 RepID=I0IIA8_PHYMF|nr:YidB family protein [Phycisphaera mikurensis]MBB6442441.1 uncharacterized protein YidB (DUF937 family) [Phycisphaera mikurensis]BAM04996.1 hypothetical protein PSMK_28370 [Phycisphaera mikurensis NBRC 102666]
MSLLGPLSNLLNADDGVTRDAGQQRGLVGMASELLGSAGGMSGLVAALSAGGLGEQVKTWLGDGPNASVSAGELEAALGSEKIQQLAAKFGLDPAAAATQLSAFLPGLLDKLSPGGETPADGDVMKQVTGLLGGLMK